MKTAISVPDDTFRRVEEQAAALNMNRSEFYSVAAERFLAELESTSLTVELNAALARGDGTGSIDATDEVARAGLAQLRELTANDDW